MGSWYLVRRGSGLVARYPQLLAILFGVNLASALLLATLPALFLASGPAHRPAIRDAADGIDAWLVVEALMAPAGNAALAGEAAVEGPSGGIETAVLLGLLVAAALPLVAWLPGAFVMGGVLLTLHEAPAPFRWRRFLWGGWHWWGAFLLFGVFQAVAVVVVLGALASAAILAPGALTWVAVGVAVLVSVSGLALLELTRVVAVANNTRHLVWAFGQAARLVRRRFLPVAGLYGLTLGLVALLHAVYRLGLLPVVPLEWWLLVAAVQQSFVAARLATRLVRLGGAVALAHTAPVPRLRGPAAAEVSSRNLPDGSLGGEGEKRG
jgi:hypothetical protein